MKPILALLACLLMLGGCASLSDTLNRPVENAEAQKHVAEADAFVAQVQGWVTALREEMDAAKVFIVAQDAKIAQARALAEASQSDAARSIVYALEQARDRVLAEEPKVAKKLAEVEEALPKVQAAAAAVKEQAAKLPPGGKSPLWFVLGTLALPILIKGAQVGTAGIPGVGPIVSGLAETAITGLWNTLATSRQKAADAEQAARAKALEHQIAVANELVKAAGEKADPILAEAKARQKAAGVHATLEPLIAAAEVRG